ncbi:MAG: LCP family protein [Lachnospiraceae bacterium]|nr:LCP family protein [Lachnospiraceae bacterium]
MIENENDKENLIDETDEADDISQEASSENLITTEEAKKKKWPKILIGVLGGLLAIALFLVGTPVGRKMVVSAVVGILYKNVNYESPDDLEKNKLDYLLTPTPIVTNGLDEDKIFTLMPTPSPDPEEVDPASTKLETQEDLTDIPRDIPIRHEDYVYNVLLVGVENVEEHRATYGRSDSMLIASVNIKDRKIKLISLLRDTWVEIENREDNRLNAAFTFGGISLLQNTVEDNFRVGIDAYAKVDFEGFQSLIDMLGGVEVTLTEEEAEYLNTTNYISDKMQRNVVPGTQVLTGNQALGYCRVRKVKAANGKSSDYGRTYRQRVVFQNLFERYKDADLGTMLKIVSEGLSYVTTNATSKDIATWITNAIEYKCFELEMYQCPFPGKSASTGKNYFGDVKTSTGKSVLSVDFRSCVEELHRILFSEGDD